jgi:hypothetical protein
MHNKYIITYECHDNAPRMWKVVQLEKYFDFSLYSHHFSLLSLTSLLSAPEREVTSPSDFKVVGALQTTSQNYYQSYVSDCYDFKPSPDVLKSAKMACVNYNLSLKQIV